VRRVWLERMLSVVVLAVTAPILVGVYEKSTLVHSYVSNKKTTESLPEIFENILQRYTIDQLIYANGPGSFMAIKVSYIFLKTLSIAQCIPLKAADAFYFNQNSPIKAIGKLFFVKTTSKIELSSSVDQKSRALELPKKLNIDDFTDESLPYYGIDAVGR